VYGAALFVNARARPTQRLTSLVSSSEPFAAVSESGLVAARLDSARFRPGPLNRVVASSIARSAKKAAAPPEPLFGGYWDLVESNGLAIADQARRFDEPLPIPRGLEVRGPASNVMVDEGAEIEGNVTFDARLGPIVVASGASIESFSRVMGPCYIGPKVKILSALIGGGTSIFDRCKIGGQVDNSVFLPFTNKAHHGYVGDSYVGSWVNLGAGCTFSNLKNTYGNVRVYAGGKKVDTGMVKLGPAVGDMAKLSIGALAYAGRMVGVGSHVSGLASEDVPSFAYHDGGSGKRVELLLESVIETQRRMMERRGMSLTRSEESLIRWAYLATAEERRKAGVKKGRLA
jgi:UDP-N-acetylglucosamine diphosphorylase / glucose-1-phosphate thymidylyltransferase / UDP-N-acetylgalactosamine diphosphorylase / glucosamine-1-phosphate N-acetyltransferase / galactosamine-1-phosphate N-acetyltransferase